MYPPSPHSSDATFILLGPQAVPVDIPNAAARVCTRSINSTLFDRWQQRCGLALSVLVPIPLLCVLLSVPYHQIEQCMAKRTRGRITDVVLVSKRADLALDSARRE